jgi:hypothetical protein
MPIAIRFLLTMVVLLAATCVVCIAIVWCAEALPRYYKRLKGSIAKRSEKVRWAQLAVFFASVGAMILTLIPWWFVTGFTTVIRNRPASEVPVMIFFGIPLSLALAALMLGLGDISWEVVRSVQRHYTYRTSFAQAPCGADVEADFDLAQASEQASHFLLVGYVVWAASAVMVSVFGIRLVPYWGWFVALDFALFFGMAVACTRTLGAERARADARAKNVVMALSILVAAIPYEDLMSLAGGQTYDSSLIAETRAKFDAAAADRRVDIEPLFEGLRQLGRAVRARISVPAVRDLPPIDGRLLAAALVPEA